MTMPGRNDSVSASSVSGSSDSEALALNLQNPWPGPAAYDEASKDFFHGRGEEAQELLRLIRLAPLTVVYGKSGLGKTSLLQAGLYPLLRAEHCLPVHLRLNFSDESTVAPFTQTMQRLMEELDAAKAEYPAPANDEGLWEFLHRKDMEVWSTDNFPLTPVLVFDQFEELFSRSGGNVELIKQVFDGLANLVENRIPEKIARDITGILRPRLNLQSQHYRIILSFREDYLPDIRAWEQKIPSLLRNYLRLEPMSRACAIEAVERSGRAVLDKDAAESIVDFVGKLDHLPEAAGTSSMVIEPVLLSLCCSQLNRRRTAGGLIDKELVLNVGQNILDNFYQDALNDPEVKGPPDAALFIENHLIQGDHFRGDYPRDEALTEHKLTPRQLSALTDRHRLLRIAHHMDTARVELIHDRLVSVVRKTRDERRMKEQQLEQERLARKAQAERDEEHARGEELRHQRDLAHRSLKVAQHRRNLAVGAAVLSILLFGWGWQQKNESEREKQRTEEATQKTEEAMQKAEKAQQGMATAIATSRLAEGRSNLPVGSEPFKEILSQGLAAYRLSEKGILPIKAESLVLLHTLLDIYSYLRKFLSLTGSTPTPALSYSPDGQILAVGGEDGMIRLIDTKDFSETGKLDCKQPPTESVWTLAYNSDGTRLAAGYARIDGETGRGLVCVFDVTQRRIVQKWSSQDLWGKPSNITSVAYGGKPRAEFVISGGSDRMLRKLNVSSGAVQHIPHAQEVVAVAASSDGRWVASGGEDAIVRVWNVADFDQANPQPREFKGHDALIERLVFPSFSNSILLSTGDDGRIIGWNVEERCRILQTKSQDVKINDIAADRGGFIAAAGADGSILLFKVDYHHRCGGGSQAASSPPEFDLITDGRLGKHGGMALGVAFNPEGDQMASAGQDGSIRIWGEKTPGFSFAQLELALDPSLPAAGRGNITAIAISPNGELIAAGDQNGNVYLWQRPAISPLPVSLPPLSIWPAHTGAVHGLAYVQAGGRPILVSGGDDGVVKRWDTAHNAIDMKDNAGPIRSIAVSPDGKTLVAGSKDGTVRLWDAATGERQGKFDAPSENELYAVGFSNDGKYIAVGDFSIGIRILDIETPGSEWILTGHSDSVMSLSRSQSQWLLSAGRDGSVLEWESSALAKSRSSALKKWDNFNLRLGFMNSVKLTSIDTSRDGKLILTGGSDGQVQLWDGVEYVRIGERFSGHENRKISAVALAPDGSFFVTADAPNITADTSNILVWPGPARWAEILCSKIVRNMSDSQRREPMPQQIDYVEPCPNLPSKSQ
ncbi:MAG: hypothetical protein J0I60_11860 [Nitrosospira sp.]|nr:hypothetical protein [Nitrosospira sp.]